MSPEIPTPEPPAATLVKRRALKLGLLASLFAVIDRATARAQGAVTGALTVEPDGVTISNAKSINFGQRFAALLTLWNPGYELGIQPATIYARSGQNFAWYKGGAYVKDDKNPINPGDGGTTMMALSDGTLTVSDKFVGKGAVPVGAILMWSGDPAKLPAGWALCNGANGTPPLQDRFVVGYNPNNPDYSKVGNTGGEAAHVLTMAEMPAHNHGPAGQHDHTVPVTGHGWAYNNRVQSGDPSSTNGSNGNCPTTTAPAHTHATQGEGKAHENRPPYYALAYIMFTG